VSHVQLRFLGSGDAFGSGGRFEPCLHLQSGNDSLLIDCGASSLIAMRRAGMNPSNIGWVLISHLHGGHFAGLPSLILDGQFSKRVHPLVIAGPVGTRQRVDTVMEAFFPGSSHTTRRFPVEFVELTERVALPFGSCTATPFLVQHPSGAPSYALRVEIGGKVLAYSGDTAWTEALVDVAQGADLFVCEAYFFEKNVSHHLSYRALVEQRGRLNCRRIIMTHMNQDLLDRLNEVEIEPADDGLTIFL
jgi:ribonuclease BN (tRNA processing enzyme)